MDNSQKVNQMPINIQEDAKTHYVLLLGCIFSTDQALSLYQLSACCCPFQFSPITIPTPSAWTVLYTGRYLITIGDNLVVF